jgi:hypothetical protein
MAKGGKGSKKSTRSGIYKDKYRVFQVPLVAWIFGGVLVAVVIIIALSSINTPNVSAQNGKPVPASVLSQLTSIPASIWNPIGIQNSTQPAVARPLALNAPTVVFIGGEYCPYCAATRWSLTIALSRFGTFSGVKYMHSSPTDYYPNTPTVSYYGGHYHSPYFKTDLVEEYNRQGLPLQKLTAAEAKLLATYDVPPYVPSNTPQGTYPIPFILIGGHYLWISAVYPPSALTGLSWSAILGDVRSGQGTIADAILANANELTAAICRSDGNQPASVCSQSSIQTAESLLPNLP